jgi:hypothetical protein
MSQISAPSRRDNPFFERLPEYRALLEEQWRQQVANIVELSYAAHSPTADEPDDGSRVSRLQVTARLISAARQQLDDTEAALARVDDGVKEQHSGGPGPLWRGSSPLRRATGVGGTRRVAQPGVHRPTRPLLPL